MRSSCLDLRVEDGVAILTLDSPPANALSREMIEGLKDAAGEFEKDETRAIVITGAGRAFSVGTDLNEFSAVSGAEELEQFRRSGQEWLGRIEGLGKPIVAAINGLCLGGGLEVALACHWRFCSERARLGFPEINLKLIPGLGGTQRLPRLVGIPKALEMILTGSAVKAEEAARIGLVDRLFPKDKVVDGSVAFLRRFIDKDQAAVSEAIKAVIQGRWRSLEDGLDLEGAAFLRLFQSLGQEDLWGSVDGKEEKIK